MENITAANIGRQRQKEPILNDFLINNNTVTDSNAIAMNLLDRIYKPTFPTLSNPMSRN